MALANNVMSFNSSSYNFMDSLEIYVTIAPIETTIEGPPPAAVKTPVKIQIFDRRGRLVKNVMDSVVDASFKAVWNGLNEQGLVVPSGVYIVVVETNSFRETRNLVVKK